MIDDYSSQFDENLSDKNSLTNDNIDPNAALDQLLAGISAGQVSDGVFGGFNLTTGIQFGIDRVNNISYIQSRNFVSGSAGWRLDSTGVFEGQSGTFRGNISGATITGSTFQTAASGQRIVIESVNNTLTFYNASNVAVAQMGGGANIGYALRIINDASTTDGVYISSAISGSVGFRYVNDGNVTNNALVIQMNGTTNNSNPSIQVTRQGAGEGIFLNIDGTGRGMLIDMALGSGYGIYITSAAAIAGINIDNSHASGIGIALNMASQTYAMLIYNHVSGGNPTGLKLDIDNGSGNGYAFEFAGDIVVTGTTLGTNNRAIRILLPSGAVYFIPCYDGFT